MKTNILLPKTLFRLLMLKSQPENIIFVQR